MACFNIDDPEGFFKECLGESNDFIVGERTDLSSWHIVNRNSLQAHYEWFLAENGFKPAVWSPKAGWLVGTRGFVEGLEPETPKAYRSIYSRTSDGGNLFVCRECLYNPKPDQLPGGEDFNDDRLTIVDGQMLCVDHAIKITNPLRKAGL